jgi:hypothetical protein
VHQYTLQYVTEFNLQLVQFPPDFPLNVLKGDTFTRREGGPWPSNFALSPLEQMKGLRAVQDYTATAFDHVGDPRAPGWPPQSVAGYDSQTVVDFLKAQGATDDFVRLFVGDNGTEVDTANALAYLAGAYLDRLWQVTFTISGGNDQLPKAFLAALGDRVMLGSPVVAIDQSSSSDVTVHYTSGATTKSITCARVVCAVPVPLLRAIPVTPAFPDDKQRAITAHTMMSADRVYVQTKSHFWNQPSPGLTGLKIVRTDQPIERIWDPSSVMTAPQGLLLAYLQGDNAARLCAMPKDARVPWVRTQMQAIFADLATEDDASPSRSAGRRTRGPWARGRRRRPGRSGSAPCWRAPRVASTSPASTPRSGRAG